MPDEMTEERVHQIAEAVPELVESLGAIKVRFALLGAAIGAIVGGTTTWFLAQRKANARADAEIAEMHEHYLARGVALEGQAGKVDLEKLVRDKGYTPAEPETSTSAPMAVQPPKRIVGAEDEAAGEPPDDSAMAENDVEGPNGVKPQVQNVFRDRGRVVLPDWDQAKELRRRSPDHPYVIHYDERHDFEGYSEVEFSYYAEDDVLCDETDEVVDPAKRDELLGEANLERFGHGSNDADIVFIRNDNLEMVIEVTRSPNSFAEEVHGFTHGDWGRNNLERMRRRERDDEG